MAAWHSERLHDDLTRLAAATPEQLLKHIDFRGLFNLRAVLYLQSAMHHSIHHRGQLSMYLRPMGAQVPSIYGESYDTARAKAAAAAGA